LRSRYTRWDVKMPRLSGKRGIAVSSHVRLGRSLRLSLALLFASHPFPTPIREAWPADPLRPPPDPVVLHADRRRYDAGADLAPTPGELAQLFSEDARVPEAHGLTWWVGE
jgi:hypothetical protein